MSLGGRWASSLDGPSHRPAAVAPPTTGASAPETFTDVPPDHPAHDDIAWLVARGVTSGYADGTFKPDAPVSRQAMAAFMYRFGGNPYGAKPRASKAPFKDVAADSPFAGEITWLVQHGYAEGFDDGGFHPDDLVTRGAMAGFLYRFAGAPDGDAPAGATPPPPDVPVDAPGAGEIAWLARQTLGPDAKDTPFEPDQPVTRAALATFLRGLDTVLHA
jgi:hypothetical protein